MRCFLADIQGSFVGLQGTFADTQCSFADIMMQIMIQGFFADIGIFRVNVVVGIF